MAELKGIIKAVCLSEAKGTEKRPVASVTLIANHGLSGDAHAGNWHRQVSLLSADKVDEFNARGGKAEIGAFGENILVSGIDFKSLPVGSILRAGEVVLKMSQIGKECHSHCQIFHRVGDCIMPREGVFATVEHGGELHAGMELTVEPPPVDAPLRAAVMTLSDKGFAGERVDTSGPRAAQLLSEAGYDVVELVLLPDAQKKIECELIRLADSRQVDLIITTGGTGFSLRDVTPEATLAVATRTAPGIAEAIRAESLKITPRAMLSRGASVLRNKTLIVNLPGSTKAVEEGLAVILPQLEHGLRILKGTAHDCARK
ncbi:MOSC domain-containing protein [uncultured Phascolarctobacterium sp.]|uniref:MOSC domain-containing protein n=1 Tax=uncultured Phascolarctobacterium sp. TaxID=512296 RepID=UPI0025FE792A|nr:MOSC domain-containing protein [uncultured Phascolarctobacterium sp.]